VSCGEQRLTRRQLDDQATALVQYVVGLGVTVGDMVTIALAVAWHLVEPCPPWLKEAWIGWLGPERVVELDGGTEGQVATVITGTEWLAHPGSSAGRASARS
jgi:hypothetical protein